MDQLDELCVELDSRITTGAKAVLEESFLQRIVNIAAQGGVPWTRLKDVFRSRGKLKTYEPDIMQIVRDLKKVTSIGGAPKSEEIFVKDHWKDAPVEQEAAVPHGWSIGGHAGAISKVVEKNIEGSTVIKHMTVSYDPLVITRRLQQIDDGTILLELAWQTESHWHRGLFQRDTVFTSKEIVKTSARGMPVGTDNALDVVQYLRAYEHHNRKQITIGYGSSSMGWQGDDENFSKHGFLCGKRQIGGNGKAIELYVGDGDARAVAEIQQGGTIEAWKDAIAVLDQWPMVRVGIYASLAAPLIAILEAPNCIVEWCGDTTGGKTVTLQAAGSCWKNGGARPPTWATTVSGIEARAQVLNDMPFIIDDTAEVMESKRKDLLTSAVYMLESGHTRTRATKDMTERPSKTWRTIVMSTGEYMLAEYAGTGGAAARVLTFWGPPLGDSSEATNATIRKMISSLRKNYGHAGPQIIEWLTDNRDKWDELRDDYARYIAAVCKGVTSPAAMRLAPAIALLQVSAELAHHVLDLPWKTQSMIEDPIILAALERAVQYATMSANKPRQAWEHVISFAESRRSQWIAWGVVPDADDEPSTGWLGWRLFVNSPQGIELAKRSAESGGKYDGSDLLAWHPSQLKKVLAEAGFPFEATLRTWLDKGVLHADSGRSTTSRKCSGGEVSHRVCLIKTTKTIWNDTQESANQQKQ